MRTVAIFFTFLILWNAQAQEEKPVPNSANGWYLSPQGTIRVLLVFAEIAYDEEPAKDPQPDGATHWVKGRLPTWKDDVFDPFVQESPQAMVTRYYHDISMGQLTVLGDYVTELVTLRQSEHKGTANGHGLGALAVAQLNKGTGLRTQHGLSVEDFDQWKRGGRAGLPKQPGADEPHSYDHVMVIIRNSTLTHGQGSVDPGSPGKLFGYDSDSQSRFGAMYGMPFEILKHEFNHLFLGGNNFHSGGGNASQFQSYFINLQGGWSMMGGASSSLLTCSAWDRDRLGWRATDACGRITVRDAQQQCVNGDLDPVHGDTGIFVLRDFVTSGDALRIRMPYLPEGTYKEWLWVENHQGYARNGSPTDRFHWEDANTCSPRMEPGLFMQLQVDRENREGTDVYNGFADYLRPVLANGNYDLYMRGDTLRNSCPFGGNAIPFVRDAALANAFTGNHEQELPVYDRNNDGKLQRSEHYVPGARSEKGTITGDVIFFGRPEHAFRMSGNRRLAMGTNPSSANMLTLVSTNTMDSFKGGAPNVRATVLNGISVELLAMDEQGSATVRVRTNDTYLAEDVRWCSDSIVLPPLSGHAGYSLYLARGKRLLLDRSRTATRITAPEKINGVTWYSAPTRFTATPGSTLMIAPTATVELVQGSEIHLLPGSSLTFGNKAKLKIDGDSRIVVHGDAQLNGAAKLFKKLRKKKRIVAA